MATPVPTKASKLIQEASADLIIYRSADELEYDDTEREVVRRKVLDAITELEKILLDMKVVQCTVPLSREKMADLSDFMMFVCCDAKDLISESKLSDFTERHAKISLWQKSLQRDGDLKGTASS